MTGVDAGVYAVIDLYGQCAQVSITQNSRVIAFDNESAQASPAAVSEAARLCEEMPGWFCKT